MKISPASIAGATAAGALVVMGTFSLRAHAYPPYLEAFIDRYPTSTLPQRMTDLTGSSCNTCHIPPDRSVEGSCYRLDLRKLLFLGQTIEQALENVEALDSDDDGVENLAEILAPRPDGNIGFHPGLIGPTGTSPCGPTPSAAVTNQNETSGQSCYANCDGSTVEPTLNVADFTCFLQRFAAGESYANCDGSTIEPTLNVADFTCFLQEFAQGCP